MLPNLTIGTYELSFAKQGFDTESHTQVIVQGDRTTTVDGSLNVGATSTTVEVTDVALMNQVDTTNGYRSINSRFNGRLWEPASSPNWRCSAPA